MTLFREFGLNDELLKGIGALGFVEPTPVQSKVIPILLKSERDLVALAQTGTGKTAAFGLPMLQLTDAKKRTVQGLVLCPTRELCLQITRDLEAYGRFAPHLKILAVYGGSSIRNQMIALHQGVHILVATPGRMNDLLRRGSAQLGNVARVVLDEADEMLSMGFQEELETILKEVPKTARTLLFSATMPSAVATMARKYLRDPEEVVLGRRNAGAENVTHECYTVHARDRYGALKRIIDSYPGFYGIVFCRTRAETQEVADRLAQDRYSSEALHGDLSQDQRDRVMKNFRVKHLQILVATDVASRGLDVNDLTHIVNYDLPTDLDVYTHRSGRTGRAGKTGISIVLAHLRESYRIRAIEQVIKKKFERKPVPTGRQVCEIKLVEILERIKKTATTGTKLNSFLPQINKALGDLSRDDLVKLLLERDFGPVVDYYQQAPDIQIQAYPVPYERPGQDRKHPDSHPSTPVRESGNDDMATVRVNIGRRDALTTTLLISIINRATRGPKLPLGRIRLMDHESIFEITASGARKVVAVLNQAFMGDKPVKAVFEGNEPVEKPDNRPPHPKYPFRKRL
ncbi:MAG: DEAD/DEAH box helicase [Fibrobacterota bacterium]